MKHEIPNVSKRLFCFSEPSQDPVSTHNEVKKTKQGKIIIIVLATAAVLAIAVIGVAYASYLNYYNSYQANTGTNTNTPYAAAPRNDFWGWLGGCFGWGNNQPYTGYQYQAPNNSTAQPPQPYAPQPNPNQGYYPYGASRGCWGW